MAQYVQSEIQYIDLNDPVFISIYDHTGKIIRYVNVYKPKTTIIIVEK